MSSACSGILLVLATVIIGSCSPAPKTVVRGAVLSPGEAVIATNRFGTVRVSYVSGLKRRFEWDGHSRVVKMIPRSEPFLGELGLYEPADTWLFSLRTRLSVGEAVHNFGSYEEAYAFLRQSSAVLDWVYTSDGLVVGFGRFDNRNQINIDLRQILINGQKPKALRGARDKMVQLRHGVN